MAEGGGALRRVISARGRTVRTRTVLGAVVVVGLALLLASMTMVVSLRRSLTENVREASVLGAQHVVAQLEGGTPPEEIQLSRDDDEFVQVVASSGQIVAATDNVIDQPDALIDLAPSESASLDVPFDDEPFLVVGAAADLPSGSFTVIVGRTLDNVIESSAAVTRLLAIGAPILLFLVAAITWGVTGRALAPVESIRSEVESITSEELHRRVPVPGTADEIARLAVTMNKMLDRLEDGQGRQRRFVSDASHELRNPVATIRQHAEVALAHPESASLESLAESVLSEDLRLQRLVEDLLLLARSDEGPLDHNDIVDLDDVVFEEIERLRHITTKSIDAGGLSAGRVLGDRKRLSRLVANLLENAARHAASGIGVSLAELGDEVVLVVDDDGPGIAPEDRQRVFERFVRLEEARDRDSGGTGLGLAIVAEVADLHRGTVRVLESPQGGARFEIRFPRAT